MTTDNDIYRFAQMLVKHHREDALIEGSRRADARLDAGDTDGYAVWIRILGAVEELLEAEPKSGEAVH